MRSTTECDHPLISNDFVKCYSDYLIINLYYFPYGNKKVKYNEIESCDLIRIGHLAFHKIKLWGMALSPIWWHCHFRRHSREFCIILNRNQWLKIGLTMDDKDINNVYKFIKEKIHSNQSFNHLDKTNK